MPYRRLAMAFLSVAAFALALPSQPATAAASEWAKGHAHRLRLIASALPGGGGGDRKLLIGLEVELQDGWKTYWRNPGDSGGMPPAFDWSQSINVAAARALFPAPKRLADTAGDTIGYKGRVIFPFEVSISDPARPLVFDLAVEIGVCREICIPAEAKLKLELATDGPIASRAALLAAHAAVPRAEGEAPSPTAPRLISARTELGGAAPRLLFETSAVEGLDLFVETPGDLYLPMARRVPQQGPADRAQFELKLTSAAEAKALAGKTLRLTLVSAAGAREIVWQVQ